MRDTVCSVRGSVCGVCSVCSVRGSVCGVCSVAHVCRVRGNVCATACYMYVERGCVYSVCTTCLLSAVCVQL